MKIQNSKFFYRKNYIIFHFQQGEINKQLIKNECSYYIKQYG
jgi:hypothetical protein